MYKIDFRSFLFSNRATSSAALRGHQSRVDRIITEISKYPFSFNNSKDTARSDSSKNRVKLLDFQASHALNSVKKSLFSVSLIREREKNYQPQRWAIRSAGWWVYLVNTAWKDFIIVITWPLWTESNISSNSHTPVLLIELFTPEVLQKLQVLGHWTLMTS